MSSSLGVILAGGLATRMGGGDKGVLPLGSSTLLSHVIDRLTPQVDGIALNVNGDGSRLFGNSVWHAKAAWGLWVGPGTLPTEQG